MEPRLSLFPGGGPGAQWQILGEAWPQFVEAFDARAGEHFAVKAPVTAGGNTEFIWISVTCIEGDRVYGDLDNAPVNLGSLELGSKVSVEARELNDWMYVTPQGDIVGGFTVKAVHDASPRKREG